MDQGISYWARVNVELKGITAPVMDRRSQLKCGRVHHKHGDHAHEKYK
jgi:hypothetical protein